MKSIKKIGLIVVTFSFLAIVTGCGNGEDRNPAQEEQASDEVSTKNLLVVDYAIEGMVCAMGCAKTIQDEVADMDGVTACDVDFEEGKAEIEFDQSIVSEKEIIAKIESIADGQYKVNEWVEKEKEEDVEEAEEEGNSENEETVTEVKLPSFEIPNLFTLLIDQL
jgi:copper chaperone CopZ